MWWKRWSREEGAIIFKKLYVPENINYGAKQFLNEQVRHLFSKWDVKKSKSVGAERKGSMSTFQETKSVFLPSLEN